MRREEKAIIEIINREDYYMLPKLMSDDDLWEWAENLRDAGYISKDEFDKFKTGDEIAIMIEDIIESGKLDSSAIMLTLPTNVRSLAIKAIEATPVRTPKLENWLKDLEAIRDSLLTKISEKIEFPISPKKKNYTIEMVKKGYVIDFITGEKITPEDMMMVLPEGPTKKENWDKAVELKKRLQKETGIIYSWHDIFDMIREGKY